MLKYFFQLSVVAASDVKSSKSYSENAKSLWFKMKCSASDPLSFQKKLESEIKPFALGLNKLLSFKKWKFRQIRIYIYM